MIKREILTVSSGEAPFDPGKNRQGSHLLTQVVATIFQLKKEDRLLTSESKKAFHFLLEEMGAGRSVRLSPWAKEILKGWDLKIDGGENIPPNRGFLLVANHYKRGPLRGYWGVLVTAQAVAEKRKEKEGETLVLSRREISLAEIEWLQRYERVFPYNLVAELTSQSGVALLVDAGKKILFPQSELRQRTSWSPFSALNFMSQGGVIGLFPEGKPSQDLGPGDPRAGRLAILAAERAIPTLPVTFYHLGPQLHANFGSLILPEEILAKVPEVASLRQVRGEEREEILGGTKVKELWQKGGQRVVDFLLEKINQHLPPQFKNR